MRRWAFNLLCGISLLVFVGSVCLWVRIYFVQDYVGRFSQGIDLTRQPAKTPWDRWGVGSNRGTITIGWAEHESQVAANKAAPPSKVHSTTSMAIGSRMCQATQCACGYPIPEKLRTKASVFP